MQLNPTTIRWFRNHMANKGKELTIEEAATMVEDLYEFMDFCEQTTIYDADLYLKSLVCDRHVTSHEAEELTDLILFVKQMRAA